MAVRLFHFSDLGSIQRFEPRPVRVPAQRSSGLEWLNGPLVWAIDVWHQPMYLFPRDCPRILLWRKHDSSQDDVARFFGSSTARILAYVEATWLPAIGSEVLYRYELPTASFQSLEDAGMWVSRTAVQPMRRVEITDLRSRLWQENVELRALDSLLPLRDVWTSSLHASGIRLRNARGWATAS